VVDVGILLQRHEFLQPNAAISTHTTEVVPLEVYQHNVFGTLFFISVQFRDKLLIGRNRFPAWSSSGDRSGVGATTIKANKPFGR
jgi:hypothetical protein